MNKGIGGVFFIAKRTGTAVGSHIFTLSFEISEKFQTP